jgi:hypothetical protein
VTAKEDDCKICVGKKEERNEQLLLGEQIVIDMTEDYRTVVPYLF